MRLNTEVKNLVVKINKEKGIIKRKIIIDHAKTQLLIHGVNSLSLRKISAELGISHGNLHYYFKTKDNLLSAIFHEETIKLNKSISSSSDGTINLKDATMSLANTILVDVEENQSLMNLFLVLIGESITNKKFADLIRKENNLYDKVLENQILYINKNISKERASYVAKIIRYLVDGFCIELIYADRNSKEFILFLVSLKEQICKLIIEA